MFLWAIITAIYWWVSPFFFNVFSCRMRAVCCCSYSSWPVGKGGLHSTNSSINQLCHNGWFFLMQGLGWPSHARSGSVAGQNSVPDLVQPGNYPKVKVAPQYLKSQEGRGLYHMVHSGRWCPLLALTSLSFPAGWKSQLVRLTAARLRQTVLEISRSTEYLRPLTTWQNKQKVQALPCGQLLYDWSSSSCSCHLPLSCQHFAWPEEEGVIWFVVVEIRCVQDNWPQAAVIGADVVRRSGHQVVVMPPQRCFPCRWRTCVVWMGLWVYIVLRQVETSVQCYIRRWKNPFVPYTRSDKSAVDDSFDGWERAGATADGRSVLLTHLVEGKKTS